MSVFDALRILSVHIREAHPEHHLADLYELVQYAGNIVPRLYLMVTVGTVYMGIEDAPVKEIMKDMMEMSRGIQHPVRGLFLRYYLSGQARDSLPGGSGDGPEGNLQDSISFILTNFVEMNKLWVRLQHQGHSREREQRTKERQELQLLVGNNLVRLSQLVDLEAYKTIILQPLLEQVVQCRDVLAQEYLLEGMLVRLDPMWIKLILAVVTQVFPDEFHLNTLDQLLPAIARLNPHVNIKAIVIGLMNRLSSYAQNESAAETEEERKKSEDEAVVALLEKVRISKEAEAKAKSKAKVKEQKEDADQPNGDHNDAAESISESVQTSTTAVDSVQTGETAVEDERRASVNGTDAEPGQGNRSRGIPAHVKLFEIFYGQVTHLVQAQKLPIQDTIALLVSLANLAL